MKYFVNTATNDLIYRTGDTIYPFSLEGHGGITTDEELCMFRGGDVSCIPERVLGGLKEVTLEELKELI